VSITKARIAAAEPHLRAAAAKIGPAQRGTCEAHLVMCLEELLGVEYPAEAQSASPDDSATAAPSPEPPPVGDGDGDGA